MLLILTIILVVRSCIGERNQFVETDASQPDIDVQLLDVNPYSRPGIESEGVKGVVIHYTANPGSTAQDNRDYFNGLQYSGQTEASSNFIVGLVERSYNVYRHGRSLMHRMSEMQIQYRLKSVTLMKQESLLMRHTVLLYSLQHGFVSNLI